MGNRLELWPLTGLAMKEIPGIESLDAGLCEATLVSRYDRKLMSKSGSSDEQVRLGKCMPDLTTWRHKQPLPEYSAC